MGAGTSMGAGPGVPYYGSTSGQAGLMGPTTAPMMAGTPLPPGSVPVSVDGVPMMGPGAMGMRAMGPGMMPPGYGTMPAAGSMVSGGFPVPGQPLPETMPPVSPTMGGYY